VNEAQLNAAASPAGAGVALAQPEELPTAVVESETEIVPGTEVVPANKDVDVTAQKAIVVTSEPGTATDTDAVIASPGIDAGGNSYTPDVPAPAVDESPALSESLQPQSTSARFALDLQSSRDWINRNSDAVGTLQISLLTYENFDADTYYEYVESLAKGQVDISKLRVLKTLTGEQQVYSVFFGDYASRDAARKAVGELPEVLRKISPVPRSVGGIMAEIQRLETQN
jgi:septal ring-binding cell division protein DamX